MKKSLVIALALVFVLGIAGTAFAATTNPFADVPAKHWSYDAVSQLAKAGIVDGYADGTFRGDKTMTRYEMAQVVAKAMWRSDKADAANKAIIDKLAAEYSNELNNLGVRVSNVEKKVNSLGNVKLGGELRWRQDYAAGDVDSSLGLKQRSTQYRARLNWSAPVDGNWTFNGRLEKAMKSGLASGDAAFGIARAYLAGEWLGANWQFGRDVVKTFNAYTGVDKDGLDGVVMSAGNKLKVDLYRLKKDAIGDTAKNGGWFSLAQMTYDFNDNFTLGVHWFADDNKAYYQNKAIGFKYSGLNNLVLGAEFGKNTAFANNPKAYEIKLDWNKADKAKVGSWATWVGYRSAEVNFDKADFSTAFRHDDAKKARMDNIKGFEYGFDYTFIKNTKFEVFYIDGTDKSTGKLDRAMGYAQLEIFY